MSPMFWGVSPLCYRLIQSVANPGINATIKDKCINSALCHSATASCMLVKLA